MGILEWVGAPESARAGAGNEGPHCSGRPRRRSGTSATALHAELAQGRGQRPHHVALGRGQQRVPHVEDQHHAQLVAVVARLVLDAVVEHQHFADVPAAVLEADAVPAVRRHDQRQVHDQPRVGLAMVRRDVRARRQRREHRVRAQTVDVGHADRLQRRGRDRAARLVLGDRRAVAPQEVAAPALRVVELVPLVDRHAGLVLHVRRELAGAFGEQAGELLADRRRARLQRRHPRELLALEERDRRQARHLQVAAHRRIRRRLAAEHGARLAPALGLERRQGIAARADALGEERGELATLAIDHVPRVRELLAQCRRPARLRRRDLQRVAIDAAGGAQPVVAFEPGGLGQQARQEIRIGGECRLDRRLLPRVVAGGAPHGRQRQQHHRFLRRHLVRGLQELLRRRELPRPERVHAEAVERLRMARLTREHLPPQLLGLAPAALVGGGDGGVHQRLDGIAQRRLPSRAQRRRIARSLPEPPRPLSPRAPSAPCRRRW
jgi:hypothetical protein